MLLHVTLSHANEPITVHNEHTISNEWQANGYLTEETFHHIRSSRDREDRILDENNTTISFDDESLRIAVGEWLTDKDEAKVKYGDINSWDVSNVTEMSYLFHDGYENESQFNDDISLWDTSSVTNMSFMFLASSFNGDISGWDTSSVRYMDEMFECATLFNGDLSKWNTSSVKYLSAMFRGAASFNGDLSKWDTSSVVSMSFMFSKYDDHGIICGPSQFNGDISEWDTSSVRNMGNMFADSSSFNGDISGWDTSAVTVMSGMFSGADSFNQNLSNWNTSAVRYIDSMFSNAKSFNGDVSGWDTSAVTYMYKMFSGAESFNQTLCWNLSLTWTVNEMFCGSKGKLDPSCATEDQINSSECYVPPDKGVPNGFALTGLKTSYYLFTAILGFSITVFFIG